MAITNLKPLLGMQAVAFGDGLLIVAIGALFFALIEAEKQMRLAVRSPGMSSTRGNSLREQAGVGSSKVIRARPCRDSLVGCGHH